MLNLYFQPLVWHVSLNIRSSYAPYRPHGKVCKFIGLLEMPDLIWRRNFKIWFSRENMCYCKISNLGKKGPLDNPQPYQPELESSYPCRPNRFLWLQIWRWQLTGRSPGHHTQMLGPDQMAWLKKLRVFFTISISCHHQTHQNYQ